MSAAKFYIVALACLCCWLLGSKGLPWSMKDTRKQQKADAAKEAQINAKIMRQLEEMNRDSKLMPGIRARSIVSAMYGELYGKVYGPHNEPGHELKRKAHKFNKEFL